MHTHILLCHLYIQGTQQGIKMHTCTYCTRYIDHAKHTYLTTYIEATSGVIILQFELHYTDFHRLPLLSISILYAILVLFCLLLVPDLVTII